MKIESNIVIPKSDFAKFLTANGTNYDSVVKDLTIPNIAYQNIIRFGKRKSFYSKVPQYLCYLRQDSNAFILPRYYFGEPSNYSNMVTGRTLTSSCNIKLRTYQDIFVHSNLDALNNDTGVLLEMPCGTGKTCMGIWLAYKHKVQTLVLVPTYYLAKQWEQRIHEMTTATCHVLQSSDKDVPIDSDFTIMVMDLFSVRKLPENLVQNIGCVILDEAHKAGAEAYLPILDEIPAKYRIALTATFRRTDGVHKILKYHFGTLLHMDSPLPKPDVYTIPTGVKVASVLSKKKMHKSFQEFLDYNNIPYVETKSTLQFTMNSRYRLSLTKQMLSGVWSKSASRDITYNLNTAEKGNYTTIESYLNENAKRRKVAISVIQKALDAGRTVLFLSKRKDVLKVMYKHFQKYKPLLVISETNKMSAEETKYMQEECPLILGVNQLAKEGLDIDRLDTLVIYLPMKDTEQAIGRISRLHPKKKSPIALYLMDDCPITYAVFRNAQKFLNINSHFLGTCSLKNLPNLLKK